MQAAITMPYVKVYDEMGNVINPVSKHKWSGSNRRSRRASMQKQRNFNNSKNTQMNVFPKMKFKKVLQRMPDRTIVHYV